MCVHAPASLAMRALLTEIFTALMLLSGVGFILIAAIGAVRLPDVLCRSQIGRAHV